MKPLECTPLDGQPDDARRRRATRAPSTISSRSTMPSAKPGEVEVVGAVHVGQLGRLAAEQRAAGLAAAVGDALDDVGDALGVEAADRDVVEEEHAARRRT